MASLSIHEIKRLIRYCKTDRQVELLDAIVRTGGHRKAARELGVQQSVLSGAVQRVQKYAIARGWSPEHGLENDIPPGFSVHGISQYVNGDGERAGYWLKSSRDKEEIQRMALAVLEAFKADIPKVKPIKAKITDANTELCNLHVLTDYHLGMKAWHEEAGEDWDLAIASTLLLKVFRYAIDHAPPAQVGVLGQIGDFLHWDGLDAVTPANRHVLDADTRFQKIVRRGLSCIRAIVEMMLHKYPEVHIVQADANHDPASSAWFREVFEMFYEKEPRVTVDNTADTYYCYEWGDASLFFHHGHKRTPANIDTVFAAKFREVWGRTKFSYGHLGHLHHRLALEGNLMQVEQHPTLAAKDAYASRGGWMAGRRTPVISYHKKYGDSGRMEITPEMVK
jgi:hypothetical protein